MSLVDKILAVLESIPDEEWAKVPHDLAEQHRKNMKNSCYWKDEDIGFSDDEGHYYTACGSAFYFASDGPKENNFKYCCYCGKPIKTEARTAVP